MRDAVFGNVARRSRSASDRTDLELFSHLPEATDLQPWLCPDISDAHDAIGSPHSATTLSPFDPPPGAMSRRFSPLRAPPTATKSRS